MKKIVGIIGLILFSNQVYSDLEIKEAWLSCPKSVSSHPVFKYEYTVELFIKNTGEIPLKVITNISSAGRYKKESGEIARISLKYNEENINGMTLVPPVSDLGIVRLLKNDITKISHSFETRTKIGDVKISYYAHKVYGHRFNNWVGEIETSNITKPESKYCKP